MHRAIVGAVFLLIAVSLIAQQAFRFVAPDKSFEASFPGQPKHAQKVFESGPFHIEQHSDVHPSMSVAFSDHLSRAHKPGQTSEDVNQAAARIVKEATEK